MTQVKISRPPRLVPVCPSASDRAPRESPAAVCFCGDDAGARPLPRPPTKDGAFVCLPGARRKVPRVRWTVIAKPDGHVRLCREISVWNKAAQHGTEDAKTQIDLAFTGSGRGLAFENTFGGALSAFRRRYSKDLSGVDLAITGVPFDQAVTNRPGTRLGAACDPRSQRAAGL